MKINKKALIDAPCGYIDADGKTAYPTNVDCGERGCDSCGWNPAEIKRRLAEGHWKAIRSRLDAETGEVINFNGKVERLAFPRKVSNEHL